MYAPDDCPVVYRAGSEPPYQPLMDIGIRG